MLWSCSVYWESHRCVVLGLTERSRERSKSAKSSGSKPFQNSSSSSQSKPELLSAHLTALSRRTLHQSPRIRRRRGWRGSESDHIKSAKPKLKTVPTTSTYPSQDRGGGSGRWSWSNTVAPKGTPGVFAPLCAIPALYVFHQRTRDS